MKNKLILAIICLLASCQSYRAERKINKLKEWGYLKDSTITRYDTIIGWSLDSVYIFDTLSKVDTISIVKNGIKSVTVIKWKERQVIQTLTQKDTIFEHKFTTKVIKEPSKWWDRFKIGLIFGSLLVVFMFYSAYKLSEK
jgi:hypothetical protein